MALVVYPRNPTVNAAATYNPQLVLTKPPAPLPAPSPAPAYVEPAPTGKYYAFTVVYYGQGTNGGGGMYAVQASIASTTQYATYAAAQTAMQAVMAAPLPQGMTVGVNTTVGGVGVVLGNLNGGPSTTVLAVDLHDVQSNAISTKSIPAPPQQGTVEPQNWNVSPGVVTPGIPSTKPVSATPEPGTTVSVELDRVMLLAGYVAPGRTVRGVVFRRNGQRYVSTPAGDVQTNINPATGMGDLVGTADPIAGHVTLRVWPAGENLPIENWSAQQARPTAGLNEMPLGSMALGRTAAAPLRPGSFQIVCRMSDGVEVIASANQDGVILHSRVVGTVDYQTGVFSLIFRSPVETGFGSMNLADLGLPGVGTVFIDTVLQSTLQYNATAYEFVPVNSEITGVRPVRLPSDGRVAVYRVGDYSLLHCHNELPPTTVANGDVIDMQQTRLSRIHIIGADGNNIWHGWSDDLDSGHATILDTTGWAQPVTFEWSIEHKAVITNVDISGDITLNQRLPHDFPVGRSYLSSTLELNDRFARVQALWDQVSWNETWVDHIVGPAATASYNTSVYPVLVDNTGCITERWLLRFLAGGVNFELYGEHVGFVSRGSINADFSPINPVTQTPYMTIRAAGWGGQPEGAGWAAGMVVRINTEGAIKGFALIRTVQPGEYASLHHSFEIMCCVDVNRPGINETEGV